MTSEQRPGDPPRPDGQTAQPHPADPLQAITAQWLDWWRQAGVWSYGNLTAAAFFYQPRQMRSAWLADLTRTMDGYLRSAPVLEWMRGSAAVMTRPTESASSNRSK